ncbi:sugar phosphate isomerase/epimerase [Petroclostridium sp. X23]|uniref:sugar phosphate isomerase/epimerase family protein n=1 Tax=Petroclostridium sp. X23 TaxID=3045146 RepID=UPI0024ADFFDE|nr:sugar phosphate isomerase/epimerase [Petroclostridium sp. X23]WHH57172.1 sugar phosphate isomerase/epimerase [Petroclostridium sp. X23]
MQLCYNVQTCSETSTLEQDIEICAKTGFQYIEINFAKAKAYLKNRSMDELASLLAGSGLICATINAIFDLSFCTPKRWKQICSQFDFACELGKACNTDKIIVLSSERADLPKGVTDKEIFCDTVAILNKLADRGSPFSMKIAFEPVGTMAVGDIRTGWEIVRTVNRSEVGLVVDDFNMFLWDLCSDLDDICQIDPDKIFMAHINDAEKLPFARIDQMHRCMPGDGRIDVVRYIECLRSAGYDGLVSVEVLNPTIWAKGPEIVIPEAYEKTQKIVG